MARLNLYWSLVVTLVLWTVTDVHTAGHINAFFQETCATAEPNPCQQECVDLLSGGFYCQCRPGYSINTDGMTCTLDATSNADPDSLTSDVDNKSEFPQHGLPEVKEAGSHTDKKASYNSNGEVMVSDKDAVSIHSVDLTQRHPPLEAGDQLSPDWVNQRWPTGQYNIPEGGDNSHNSFEVSINALDIPEGGQSDSEEWDVDIDDMDLPPAFTGIAEGGEGEEEVRQPSCDDVVCHNNGTCAIVESKAICLCPLGHFGDSCEREVEVRYPKFVGSGYLALPVLRDAHKEFTVSLEFKPNSGHGLLLFSGELSDAKTDFFSVVLDDGFAVLRFDCGTGTAELRSPERILLAHWNTLELTRVDNLATLRLNNGHQVEGSSKGEYTRITFRLPLYLGGYTDMWSIRSRVGTMQQFDGCVQHLSINGHRFDFRPRGPVGEAEFGLNVGECSDGVCDQVQCLNGGQCTARSADRYICLCPLGFHGNNCEKDSPIHVPHFSGHSYLELPGLQRSVLSYTELEVIVKPTSHDGTILYNGYSRDRRGDFISLALENRHIVFRFDLGTGPAIIRSAEPVMPNTWHLVRAWRTGALGTLQVDDQIQVTAEAQGAFTQLTLLDSLYLGGHPNFDHTSKHAEATRSFSGCLQKVVINKQNIEMLRGDVRGVNIGPCSHPCAGRPCMNDGQCKPRLDTYTCYCPLGYSNTNCEDAQESVPTRPMFGGESYLMYTQRDVAKRVLGNKMDLQLYIRPVGHDGLIFWSGEDRVFPSRSSSSALSSIGDFIALGFKAGDLQLRYNLGSGEALIGYKNTDLFDGNWHYIHIQRDKQDAYMEVDRVKIVEGSSPGGYTSLNTNKVVYLGGMPDVGEATGGRFSTGYVGCVRSMKLATDYDVKLLAQAAHGINVEQCRKLKHS